MKNIFVLSVLLSYMTIAFAFEDNGTFAIKEQDTAEGYQQYVGKSFFVRPAIGTRETWDKSGFKYKDSFAGKTFIISKINVKNVLIDFVTYREVTVYADEYCGDNKIKFKGYGSVIPGKINSEQQPLIGLMPIVFIEPFEEFKKEYIGKTVSHELVKDKYEIIDVYFDVYKSIPCPYFTIKNIRTEETAKCSFPERNTAPFESALKGNYKTALLKVDKPKDATNRYSKTQTITDDGIEKYSFDDSIIDITIYGTEKEFQFELTNVSDHSIKIIWNEAVFAGLDGTSSKIMHSGIKYSEREGDQPATVVLTGAKIVDVATPTANVHFFEGFGPQHALSHWETRSMLPEKYEGNNIGEIRLMLPIQIKDVVNEYTFVFKVYYSYDHPELLYIEKL